MFRTRLRELREAAGYKSQQAFADAFGVAQSTVGNWEAGKREPNFETTIRLSHFFNIAIDYLLGNENNIMQDKQSALFRHNLSIEISTIDSAAFSGVSDAEYDYHRLEQLVHSTYPISLEEAFNAADTIGVPLDDLLRENYEDFMQKEKSAPTSRNGLNEIQNEMSTKLNVLYSVLQQLNEEGSEKLLDYADDLVASGRYIKSGQFSLGQREA